MSLFAGCSKHVISAIHLVFCFSDLKKMFYTTCMPSKKSRDFAFIRWNPVKNFATEDHP
jgi:hypothetical protein